MGAMSKQNQPFEYYSDLVQMASDVDWLVVCLPGDGSTNLIVNSAVLEALGKNGFLVNVARGSVIDEGALCDVIANGKIAGAALDVFKDEPVVPNILLESDRVVLTPHAASATDKTRQGMGDLVISNIVAHLQGNPLLTQVV